MIKISLRKTYQGYLFSYTNATQYYISFNKNMCDLNS